MRTAVGPPGGRVPPSSSEDPLLGGPPNPGPPSTTKGAGALAPAPFASRSVPGWHGTTAEGGRTPVRSWDGLSICRDGNELLGPGPEDSLSPVVTLLARRELQP